MGMTSKGLITMTQPVLFCWLILELLHISKDIMSIKKSGHLFFKKSFVEKWNLAVAVKKSNVVVEHLLLRWSREFAKAIFYFLRADEWSECKVIVTAKPVNCGDGDGTQVPCLLNFHGQKSLIGILKQQLDAMKYFYFTISTFTYILRKHSCITLL